MACGSSEDCELCRVAQKTQKPLFLFRLLNRNGLAFVTAQRTEQVCFAAFAPHAMNAATAHHLMTVRAFVDDMFAGMAGTDHPATRQHHGRFGPFALELWNGDLDVGVFDQ